MKLSEQENLSFYPLLGSSRQGKPPPVAQIFTVVSYTDSSSLMVFHLVFQGYETRLIYYTKQDR